MIGEPSLRMTSSCTRTWPRAEIAAWLLFLRHQWPYPCPPISQPARLVGIAAACNQSGTTVPKGFSFNWAHASTSCLEQLVTIS